MLLNPQSIDLVINGFFKWNGEYINGETEYCLHTSGSSILYPYARAAISSVSALDGEHTVILKTVNFYDVVKSNMKDSDDQKEAVHPDDIPT